MVRVVPGIMRKVNVNGKNYYIFPSFEAIQWYRSFLKKRLNRKSLLDTHEKVLLKMMVNELRHMIKNKMLLFREMHFFNSSY